MEYFIDAFKNYANFDGRATRTQYWMYILVYVIIAVILAVLDNVLGTGFLGLVFSLVMLVPSISIAARRLHDMGRSGWWQLIVLIPLVGSIVLLVFLVQPTREDSAYG